MQVRTALASLLASTFFLCSCHSVNDDRIPPVPVYINLGTTGMWNTYGVTGFGLYRCFIRELQEPSNFSYTQTTYTGYGGVLLIGAMDPFTAETQVPMAYDLACPVECKPEIRVFIDEQSLEAICPQCESHYDVCMAGGSPLSGPALSLRYGLRRLNCYPTEMGGYVIQD